jgi:hypothetical protein
MYRKKCLFQLTKLTNSNVYLTKFVSYTVPFTAMFAEIQHCIAQRLTFATGTYWSFLMFRA